MAIRPATRGLPTATRLGFRRVEEVRVILDDRGSRAEVTGVTHRLPHTARLTMRLATALVREGARLRLDDRRSRRDESNLPAGAPVPSYPEAPGGR